jgi:hypothetical protein
MSPDLARERKIFGPPSFEKAKLIFEKKYFLNSFIHSFELNLIHKNLTF